MQREQDNSTERVSRHRRHQDGDHSLCIYERCAQAKSLYHLNEEHLFTVALFAELDNRGVDAAGFFGDEYDRARDLADTELPDYEYLPCEPDSVHRIQARQAVRLGCN